MNDIVQVIENDNCNGLINKEDNLFDIYFKIHEQINSKNEETSKSYNDNILVSFSDIEELHTKTIQSILSLKPVKESIIIRIATSHNKGESDKFNSFELFKTHNTTSPNPTLNVIMTYAFTIYDKELSEFENYKVINHIRSRLAELNQLEKEAPPFIPKAIINSMVTKTATITVQYSDYVKARHFIAMFDEWVKGCEESNNIKIINTLKKISHLIPRFGKILILALLAFLTSKSIDSNIITSEISVKFIVIYASIFVAIGTISESLLRKIESCIDNHLAISYININKGDIKLKSQYEARNRSSLAQAIFSIIGTLVIGIMTNSVYDMIKWLIQK